MYFIIPFHSFPSCDAAFCLVINLVEAGDLFMAMDLLPSLFSLDAYRSFFDDAYDYRSNGADDCALDIISEFFEGENYNEASPPTESANEGAHETAVPGPMTDGSGVSPREASDSPPPLRSKRLHDALSEAEQLDDDSNKRTCLRGPVSPKDHNGHDPAVAVTAMTNESASDNDLPGAYSDATLPSEATHDAALGRSATEGPWLADYDAHYDAQTSTENAAGDGNKEAALVISDAERLRQVEEEIALAIATKKRFLHEQLALKKKLGINDCGKSNSLCLASLLPSQIIPLLLRMILAKTTRATLEVT
jgi:hypothetical protein